MVPRLLFFSYGRKRSGSINTRASLFNWGMMGLGLMGYGYGSLGLGSGWHCGLDRSGVAVLGNLAEGLLLIVCVDFDQAFLLQTLSELELELL